MWKGGGLGGGDEVGGTSEVSVAKVLKVGD